MEKLVDTKSADKDTGVLRPGAEQKTQLVEGELAERERNSRYKIFLHLGQYSNRHVPNRTSIERTLAPLGFSVVGSNPQLDKYGPGVDYFHDADEEGAKKVVDLLNMLLGSDQTPIKPRKQNIKNPEGFLGVWF